MISLHLKYQALVTVTEPVQGTLVGNGLKVVSFFYQYRSGCKVTSLNYKSNLPTTAPSTDLYAPRTNLGPAVAICKHCGDRSVVGPGPVLHLWRKARCFRTELYDWQS
jgi:hypothetical protein